MKIVGIDPGLSGAIALYGEYDAGAANPAALLDLHDLPVMAKGKGAGKVRNEINAAGLADLLRSWGDVLVVCETVASMPGQGVATMMSLGDTKGCIRGVVATLGYPLEWITARSWKSYFGISIAGQHEQSKRTAILKELARAKAIQLFPSQDFSRKKDHNRAEAALIAKYGYERFGRTGF